MNIVIVGGGTAGWICSYLLSRVNQNHSITVISSSEIGTIGVGESTTGLFTDIVSPSNGIDTIEFLRETDSTIKTAVLLKDWDKNNTSFYSPIDGSVTSSRLIDVSFYYAIYAGLPRNRCNIWSILAENKRTSINKKNLHIGDVNPALHIDTYKTSEYLKKKCINNGVTHINSIVEDVILNEFGFIKKLILKDNVEIEGEFFIDASGFSRKLINKTDSKFISYKENLPVNKAIVFNIEKSINEDYQPITVSQAMSSGWMWKIPTKKRYGMGYVYCDKYQTEESAVLEVEKTIETSVKDYRVINFESGRLDKLWNKNCLCIGVGGSFLEPLQATSIHTTILQIHDFINSHLKESFSATYSEYSEKIYNRNFSYIIDHFKNFVSMHYGGKKDSSPFWKDIEITEQSKNLIGLAKHRLVYKTDFGMTSGIPGPTTYELCSYVLDGIGAFKKEKCKELFDEHPDLYYDGKEVYESFYKTVMPTVMNDFFSPNELDLYLSKS
jgi:tryptophan halogenase